MEDSDQRGPFPALSARLAGSLNKSPAEAGSDGAAPLSGYAAAQIFDKLDVLVDTAQSGREHISVTLAFICANVSVTTTPFQRFRMEPLKAHLAIS